MLVAPFDAYAPTGGVTGKRQSAHCAHASDSWNRLEPLERILKEASARRAGRVSGERQPHLDGGQAAGLEPRVDGQEAGEAPCQQSAGNEEHGGQRDLSRHHDAGEASPAGARAGRTRPRRTDGTTGRHDRRNRAEEERGAQSQQHGEPENP